MTAKCKQIDGFNKDTIYSELKNERYGDVKTIRKIVNFIFTPCIIDITKELEKDFKEQGNRHYSRLLLVGIILYCFSLKMSNTLT